MQAITRVSRRLQLCEAESKRKRDQLLSTWKSDEVKGIVKEPYDYGAL